jgi:protease II
VYDYNTKDKRRTLLKRDEVLAGFDQNNYVTERLWAAAHDGMQGAGERGVPQGRAGEGDRPLLQYGYGSYGYRATPTSTPLSSRCSTAASSMPSRTSAAARRWAASGTTTAS